jgi:PBP1b-binding outer membrane lipoprotein LpoB
MKYLILAITIALIGCSENPASTAYAPEEQEQETKQVQDDDKDEIVRSPYEWCAEEIDTKEENIYDTDIDPHVDCTTPINKDLYDKFYSYHCNIFKACNPERAE